MEMATEAPVQEAPVQVKKKKKKQKASSLMVDKSLYLMLIPSIVLLIIYHYIPVVGIIIAFQNYDITGGLFGSQWVGLENFRYALTEYPNFWHIVGNTVYIAIFKMVTNFCAPIIVALMINEVQSTGFKRTIQTLVYLPHFISWVILGGIFISALNPTSGVVNTLLIKMGVIDEGIYFLGNGNWFRFIIIFTDVWKNFGYGTILYMAALTGIDPTLYEAAIIDRASRFQRMRYITLPGITPIIVLQMIMSLGGILGAGFDQIFILYNTLVYDKGDVLDTFLYRIGIVQFQYDLSTAIGLVKSFVGLGITCISYTIAYKKFDYRIF